MTEELQRLIRNARIRQEGRALTEDELKADHQFQALEEFKVFLAHKIDLNTRFEVLMGADFFWRDSGPSVRFTIDGHVFLLSQQNEECQFCEETAGQCREIKRLSTDDSQFEDRLLVGIGEVLDP